MYHLWQWVLTKVVVISVYNGTRKATKLIVFHHHLIKWVRTRFTGRCNDNLYTNSGIGFLYLTPLKGEEGEENPVTMVTHDSRNDGEFPGLSSPIYLANQATFSDSQGCSRLISTIVSVTITALIEADRLDKSDKLIKVKSGSPQTNSLPSACDLIMR